MHQKRRQALGEAAKKGDGRQKVPQLPASPSQPSGSAGQQHQPAASNPATEERPHEQDGGIQSVSLAAGLASSCPPAALLHIWHLMPMSDLDRLDAAEARQAGWHHALDGCDATLLTGDPDVLNVAGARQAGS